MTTAKDIYFYEQAVELLDKRGCTVENNTSIFSVIQNGHFIFNAQNVDQLYGFAYALNTEEERKQYK